MFSSTELKIIIRWRIFRFKHFLFSTRRLKNDHDDIKRSVYFNEHLTFVMLRGFVAGIWNSVERLTVAAVDHAPIRVFQMACFEILKNFSYLVTTQAMQVKTNMLLSVLKIAEVDVLLPPSKSWGTNVAPDACTMALTLVTITVVLS